MEHRHQTIASERLYHFLGYHLLPNCGLLEAIVVNSVEINTDAIVYLGLLNLYSLEILETGLCPITPKVVCAVQN